MATAARLRVIRSISVALVCFALLLAGIARAQTAPVREIVYGGDSEFPPYEFLDPDGNPAGLNIDLIRAVAASQRLKVKVVLGRWDQIRQGIMNGSIDVASMYRSPQRATEVDFAIPHELIYHEVFVRRGSAPIRSLADLRGKQLLVQTNTLSVDALTDMGYGPQLHPVPSEPDALRALARGEGDAAIVTQTAARPFQDRAQFSHQITTTGPPVLLTEYAFVTRKGRRDLIEQLNQGVASVKASGQYERIFDRWLRPDRSAVLLRKILWAAGMLVVIAGLVVVWNWMLQKRVERQIRKIRQLDSSYRALSEYQAQIDLINKELEAFSYSVSHDLRAPLRAIDGYTRILMEDYGTALDVEGQRVCRVICDSVRSMQQLIDDLLNFSRLSRAAINPAPVNMRNMAAEEYGKLAAQDCHLEIGPLPIALADPRLLRHVWANLLSNAVKFSARCEHPVIAVSGQEQDGQCIYTVSDNGVGFDMQYVDRLFGVFQRLHSTREFEGTGVGLAIVARIVARHGGRVWAEGKPGKGASFHFTLPSVTNATAAASAAGSDSAPSAQGGRM